MKQRADKTLATKSNPVVAWFRDADQYIFGFGSPTTLGIFRILFGFWVLVNYLLLLPYWRTWFTESGYVPAWLGELWFRSHREVPSGLAHLLPGGFPTIDLLIGVTDPRITYAFILVVLLAALLTCLGLFTRISAFVLFIGVVSLHHRNGAILHGGDTMMRMAVIYMAVSPCGKACSLDRLIGLWRNTAPHEPEQVSLWSQRLIAFNVALVYFTSVWLKWDGDKWRNLTASYYPQHLAEFYRFPYPEFMRSMWFSRITTLGTLLTEFSLGTLVFFPPVRKYVLCAGVMMHAWIEYSMNIPLFSFQMISSYIAFFHGEEIIAWVKRAGMKMRRFHLEVRLPEGHKLTPRGVAFFSALDPLGLVSYLPGTEATVQTVRSDGSKIGFDRGFFTRSVAGWLFLWIPGLPSKLLSLCLEPVKAVELGEPTRPERQPSSKQRRRQTA